MLGQSNYLALVGGGKRPKFPQNKACLSPHMYMCVYLYLTVPAGYLG